MENKKIESDDRVHGENISGRSEAELRYSAVFEQSPDGILIVDAEGKILDFNKATHADLGYTREEFANFSISDIDPVESPEEIRAHIQRTIGERKAEFEVTQRTRAGELRNVLVITQAIELSGRTVLHTIWRDITDRKTADKKVRYLASILEHVPDGVCSMDTEGRIVSWNEGSERMLGYRADEIIGRPVHTIIPEEKALEEVDHCIHELNRTDSFTGHVTVRVAKDGRRVPVEISGLALRDGQKIIGYASIMRDITDRKKVEQSLRVRKKQLAESQRIGRIGSWEHNLTTGQVFWSDELFRLLGLDPETDPGDFKMFFDMIHPDDRPVLKTAIDETVRTGKHFSVDYRLRLQDGRTRILHAQAELIHDDTGTETILSGTGQDITERKAAEDKIRQSEAFIRNILDTVDEGFIVVDRDLRILTANRAYCGQVGVPGDSIIGRHCYEVSHKTLRPCHEEGEECAVRHVFETGEPHTALHKHPDARGSILYVETNAFPIKDGVGAVTSVIETVNNITEKHLLEEEQLKTQKLEAIGTLAGGIAHDFNNLLQGVFGYISLAKMTLDQKERALAMLEQAEKALHMSVNLTTQLLTFSKGGKPVKKKMRLQSVIENSVRFALSGSRADYRITFDKNLWEVDADEGQLGQVIQNIVLNADQAMPVGGTITVAARNVCAPEEGLSVRLSEGKYAEISVKDNGIGIPEEYFSKLFDPYFTTKERGSGLGLATSYSIIKNHGGLIDLKSQPGKGSTFFVYLPAVAAEAERFAEIAEAAHTARKGRVLVMDDEEIVRNIAGIMLQSFGHEVEFAENGGEVLAKYREAMASGRRFDVVILDLTIRGGMGGEEALRGLLALDPEVRAVVSSGYSDSETLAEYQSRGFSACLAKPYKMDVLREVLNALLK